MTRIAIVLGGGASLGSYIGGALTEILTAVEQNRGRHRAVIDVITGSSAGALNGALAARALTVNRHLLPWIERAWVDGADVSVLLDPARRERGGWLDGSALDELVHALVAADPASDDEPSPAAGRTVRVGFTLANLYGVPHDYRVRFLNAPERTFGTRVHADHIRFELAGKSRAGDPVWRRMAGAAVASASFPFAFPPRRIDRDPSEYPEASLATDGDGRLDMWYVDGGLFDNAPLGLARSLVELDEGHRADDRRYLFVEPTLQGSAFDPAAPDGPPGTITGMAAALARAVLGQGAAQDWIHANRINSRLVILRALVGRLPEIAPELAEAGALGLGRYIGELAETVAEMQCSAGAAAGTDADDPVVDHLDSQIERIESDPAYADALGRIGSRAGRSRLAKVIFVLEAAGDLQNKDVLPLYLVAPERIGGLSGDFLAGFGGFFSREWRANDFRAGRRDARRVLEESLQDVLSYEPGHAAAYRVEELEPDFNAIPAAGKAKLDALVDTEADHVLAELQPGPLAAAFGWAWKPVVRRWARDRVRAALRSAH
jgi:hypothetical protein